MTKKEIADRNIGMTFDFARQVLDDPKLLDTIKDKTELEFIDKDISIKPKDRVKGKVSRYKVDHTFAPIRG